METPCGIGLHSLSKNLLRIKLNALLGFSQASIVPLNIECLIKSIGAINIPVESEFVLLMFFLFTQKIANGSLLFSSSFIGCEISQVSVLNEQ